MVKVKSEAMIQALLLWSAVLEVMSSYFVKQHDLYDYGQRHYFTIYEGSEQKPGTGYKYAGEQIYVTGITHGSSLEQFFVVVVGGTPYSRQHDDEDGLYSGHITDKNQISQVLGSQPAELITNEHGPKGVSHHEFFKIQDQATLDNNPLIQQHVNSQAKFLIIEALGGAYEAALNHLKNQNTAGAITDITWIALNIPKVQEQLKKEKKLSDNEAQLLNLLKMARTEVGSAHLLLRGALRKDIEKAKEEMEQSWSALKGVVMLILDGIERE